MLTLIPRTTAPTTSDLILLTRNWCVPRLDYTNATPEQQLLIHIRAATHSCRTAVISGLAAALIHGIPILNHNHDTHVELTLPHHHKPPSRTQWPHNFYYRDAYLPPEDFTIVAGHRVTTIPRTFADIYARHGTLEALAYLESALNQGHTKQEFQDYLTAHHGQWNTVKLQHILDIACYGIESVQETYARYTIITQLPTALVSPQAIIPVPHRTVAGRWSFKRADLLIDNWLVVEIDGHTKYTGSPHHRLEVFHNQIHRDIHISRHGYHILRFTPAEISTRLIPIITKIRYYRPATPPTGHTIYDLTTTIPYWTRTGAPSNKRSQAGGQVGDGKPGMAAWRQAAGTRFSR